MSSDISSARRRGGVPNPTTKDIADWRRLLRAARACANNPQRPTGELYAASTRATKAVFATGKEDRTNPWSVLLQGCGNFCAKRAERAALAGGLLDHVKVCEDLLGPATPAGRFRADLDG